VLRRAPRVGLRREEFSRLAFTEWADPPRSVARGVELSVMVRSLVVFIRVPGGRSETVVAAGLRSEEIRPDTSGRGARWGSV
jgi:hypothetical protein